ncbi:MAG: zinc ribbon domain-containing protein [Coriobacteriales bacterium]|nr:zinc ribbon domain-containing protein [Coriobacteriales bacterium]
MPVYGYRCKECNTGFDLSRPMSEAGEPAECPACSSEARRLFTPTGVVFKGSGFHNTDYKSKPSGSNSSEKKPTTGEATCPAAEGGGCASCPSASKEAS